MLAALVGLHFCSGVGNIVQINGIMNAKKYRQVLIHYAITSGTVLLEVVQYHNDPKHIFNASEIVREIKKYNVFTHCCIKESIIQRMCFNVIR